jgi:hypothetical protein
MYAGAGNHRVRLARLTMLVAVAVLSVIGPPKIGPAAAAESLTLQVAPASLTLQPGDVVRAELLLTNVISKAITITKIVVPATPRLVAEVTGLRLPVAVAPGQALRATLNVRAASGVQDAVVAVVAEYRTAGVTARELATGSVPIKATGTTTPEVALIGVPSKLNDGQDGHATVRISNPTSFAYGQVTVSALDGDYVDVVLPAESPSAPFTGCPKEASTGGPGKPLACLARLPAGEIRLLDVRIKAHHDVRTGPQHFGVVLSASRDTGQGGPMLPPAVVVASGEVELTIFGVDAISPFGIGTLFVLPGLTAVLLFLLLARVYPRTASLPETIDLKDLRALPIVVPLGFLAYVIVWAVWGRNLTREVSTWGVGMLFAVGFGLGLVMWAILAGLWWRHSGRKKFNVGDGPAEVLKRVQARGTGLSLPEFTASGVRYLYLVPTEGDKVLAAPVITYEYIQPKDMDELRWAHWRAGFRRALERDDIDAVRRAVREHKVTLRSSPPTGVAAFPRTAVTVTKSGRLLEEVQSVQAERVQAEWEQAEREQAEREQAEREQAEREQAEREQAQDDVRQQ